MTAPHGPWGVRFWPSSTMPETLQKGQYVEKRFTANPDAVEVREADDDGRKQIRMPVSSSATDRDGDQFSEEGLKDLRDQINEGRIPMFLDHGRGSRGGYYSALGMVGRWDSAEIEQEGDDLKVLYAIGTPTKANPDADDMVALIEDEMPVGSSVGFRVLDYDGDRQEGYKFNKSDLLEISNVGIPSNPETVNAGADVGALAAKGGMYGQPSAPQAQLGHYPVGGFTAPGAVLTTPEQQRSALQAPGGTMTEDKDTTDNDDDDRFDRVLSLLERTADTVNEQTERLDALEAELEQRDEGDDDDEDDEDEDDEDDDDEDDEKSVTIVAGKDADEETVKRLEEMREAANDDGTLSLADSETKLFGEVDEDDETEQRDATDGTADTGGWTA